MISGVKAMEQEQRSGDQNRGPGQSASTASHSQPHEWTEKLCDSGHVVLTRVSSAHVHVHVSLSTRARPGHARGRQAHAHMTSSVTRAQVVSHTPSLYSTNTLSFLHNIFYLWIEISFVLSTAGKYAFVQQLNRHQESN